MSRERQVDSAGVSDAAAEDLVAKEVGGRAGLRWLGHRTLRVFGF